jgi:hypothetical protein
MAATTTTTTSASMNDEPRVVYTAPSTDEPEVVEEGRDSLKCCSLLLDQLKAILPVSMVILV